LLSDILSFYDIICKQSLAFANKCLVNESELVRYGVLYGRMHSTMRPDVHYCIKHYSSSLAFDVYWESYTRTLSVLELLMLKLNIVCIPGIYLNGDAIDMCISAVCSG